MLLSMLYLALFFDLFFFFQAEDGIRDVAVTGVQTCALPISESAANSASRLSGRQPTNTRWPRSTSGAHRLWIRNVEPAWCPACVTSRIVRLRSAIRYLKDHTTGRNVTAGRTFSAYGARRVPRIPQPHGALAPVDPAQAHDPARQAHQHPRLQAAGERDRDAHGVRGDQGLAARIGGHRDAAREDVREPGGGEEADAGADPSRRARHGGGHFAADPIRPRGSHRSVSRPRDPAARGLLLQDPFW